jgi:hypothetical protein
MSNERVEAAYDYRRPALDRLDCLDTLDRLCLAIIGGLLVRSI